MFKDKKEKLIMKKIIVVSKTHLDLGFTDYAENIRKKYIEEFIPQAIDLASQVNSGDKKNFIWTTGSWIIKEALEHSENDKKEKLIAALKNGDIAAHGMPFTTHSELFDADTFEYGLSIIDKIDEITDRKTVCAKMTDVPGHTKAIVPLLAKKGIKLLHIGVNGVSAMPEVPQCFLWKCNDAEIVVIYSGDYGGAYKSELTDEILYFDHTLDNHGAPSPQKVMKKLEKIKREHPGYQVSAGTLDEYAQIIWNVRDKLPVYEGEIGDSWIHGSAADPYKSAALRELMRLKRKWLADGSMKKMSAEYINFSDSLLCIGEHTCGMDGKKFFADYEHYLKSDFQRARKRDTVKVKKPFRDFPQNFLTVVNRFKGEYEQGSYKVIEKSWKEQRLYIDKAVSALSDNHKQEAQTALDRLISPKKAELTGGRPYDGAVEAGGYQFAINEYGGIQELSYKGDVIIQNNNKGIIEYRSYSKKDYDFWFSHYSRNMNINFAWGYPDFGRPLLKYVDGKYPTGRFFYQMTSSSVVKKDDCVKIAVTLACKKILSISLGAPKEFQIIYTLNSKGLTFEVSWFGKDANRLTEAIFLHMFPCSDRFRLIKTGSEIDYRDVASMGGRNLHAVERCILTTNERDYSFVNRHNPLISIGKGKILEYDNKIESVEKDGISYVLYNNVWGTNFPLWYEDNASFTFTVAPDEKIKS